MRIDRVTPFLVDRCLLVRVYTSDGIVGTGEAGLWSHHKLVFEAISELAEYYVGKDPGRIEHHYQVVTRDTHFDGAVLSAAKSAVDVALWDILGKSTGKPVHQLLGGKVRDRVRVYENVVGDSPKARAESARRNLESGYTAMRTTPFYPGFEKETSAKVVGQAVEIVAAIRDAVGYEVDLGIEIHRVLNLTDAVTLGRELGPFRIWYFEDPLPPESTPSLRYVAEHIDIPIAAGERSYTIHQFKDILDTRAVSMIRADLSLCGGFTQMKKIAALAEAAFVGVFPHLMGSPVNIAAFVQLDAAIPNYVVQESNPGADRLNDILDEPLKREGGYITVPDKPGIGVELREEKLAQFPYRPRSIAGTFRADGSVTSSR